MAKPTKAKKPSASITITLGHNSARKLYYNAAERCIAISRFCEKAIQEAMDKAGFVDVPDNVDVELPIRKSK